MSLSLCQEYCLLSGRSDYVTVLRPLKVVRDSYAQVFFFSLTVVSRVPSRWYSLFDGNFFLEKFKVLHLSTVRLIAQV